MYEIILVRITQGSPFSYFLHFLPLINPTERTQVYLVKDLQININVTILVSKLIEIIFDALII